MPAYAMQFSVTEGFWGGSSKIVIIISIKFMQINKNVG